MVRVPRVATRSVGEGLGGDGGAELGGVGAPEHHQAGVDEATGQPAVVGRTVGGTLQEPAPTVVRLAGHHHPEVLEEERHPAERPSGSGPAASARASSNRSWMTALISGLTLSMRSDGGLDELRRRDMAVADQCGLGDGVHGAQVDGVRRHGGIVGDAPCHRLRPCESSPRPTSSGAPLRRPRWRPRWPRAVKALGGECDEAPVADGGEGTLAALGGPTRSTLVMGPLGDPVDAPWRLRRGTAVIEMALASGLALSAGRRSNDPMAATTHGTGELIAAALDAGRTADHRRHGRLGHHRRRARRRPGVWGAGRLRSVELIVACDVRTTLRRRRSGVRTAEGGDAGPGGAADPPARAAGRRLPGGLRRRRRAAGRAAAPPAGWPAGWPLWAVSWSAVSTLVADELDLSSASRPPTSS